jgi:hypothetical protein
MISEACNNRFSVGRRFPQLFFNSTVTNLWCSKSSSESSAYPACSTICVQSSLFGFGVARVLVAVALLLMIVSCARQQSIELSVERAVLENSLSGKPAMTVYFNSNSAREFEIFTAKRFGYFMEVKFHDVILGRGIIRNPIGGGHFEILVLPDRFDGTLNEGNAAEIAQKLSSGDAKLEARVADSAKTRLWEWKN